MQHLCNDAVPTRNLSPEVPPTAVENVPQEEFPTRDNANIRERADSLHCRENNAAEDLACGQLLSNNNVADAASDVAIVQNTNEPTLFSEAPNNTTSMDINTTQSPQSFSSLGVGSQRNKQTTQKTKKTVSNAKPPRFVMRCLHSAAKSASTCA